MRAVSSPRKPNGFATISALVLSLAIALVVAASMATAFAELSAARRDALRGDIESRLDGAHIRAAYAIAASPGAERLAWSISLGGQRVDVLAESETMKVSFATAGEIFDDGLYGRLGANPEVARQTLAAAAQARSRDVLLEAPLGPLWRACVLSLASPVGDSAELPALATTVPQNAQPDWRTGQIWRVRASDGRGWTDDRLVRWSGDGRAPAFIIERRVYRRQGEEVSCDAALA